MSLSLYMYIKRERERERVDVRTVHLASSFYYTAYVSIRQHTSAYVSIRMPHATI